LLLHFPTWISFRLANFKVEKLIIQKLVSVRRHLIYTTTPVYLRAIKFLAPLPAANLLDIENFLLKIWLRISVAPFWACSTIVRPPCTVVRLSVCFHGFFQGSVWPLFLSWILLNTIFFIKTRRFSLKAQISYNISIITSKEANISFSHLD